MRIIELAGAGAIHAPVGEQVSIHVVLGDSVTFAAHHPDVPIFCDVDITRLRNIVPFVEVPTVGIEDLNAVITAIGHEHAAFRIDRDVVYQHLELSRTVARTTPLEQELAVLVELDNTCIDVAVGDIERAVGREREVSGLAEMVVVGPHDPLLAECHEQSLAVVAEFKDLLAYAVNYPDIPLRVVRADLNRMWHLDQVFPLLPLIDNIAVGVEYHDKVMVG